MSERIWHGLSPAQADGLACVVCAVDYLTVPVAHRPVGRSQTGSQVFACRSACAEQAHRLMGTAELPDTVRVFLAAWDDIGASWESLAAPVAAMRRALRTGRWCVGQSGGEPR